MTLLFDDLAYRYSSYNASKTQKGSGQQEPERIKSCGERQCRRGSGEQSRNPGAIRTQCQDQTARAHQPDGKRHQRRLNDGGPAPPGRTPQQSAHSIREHGGRNAHRKRCGERAAQACDGIADERDNQHVGPRRELGYCEHIGELLVGHPVPNLDRNPVHLRNRGIRATYRKQRHQPERPNQCQNRIVFRTHAETRRRVTKVMAMLSGIATSNTAGNGSRSNPIAINTASITSRPTKSRSRISGIIIRNTTAISRPTAAQDTPAKIRRSASIWPKRDKRAANTVTMTMGRRAQTSTPPKPVSDILANAMNSVIRLGGTDVGSSGATIAAGGESGGMDRDLERWPCHANLICPVPARKPAARILLFSSFA